MGADKPLTTRPASEPTRPIGSIGGAWIAAKISRLVKSLRALPPAAPGVPRPRTAGLICEPPANGAQSAARF